MKCKDCEHFKENLPPNIKPTFFGMAAKVEYALPDEYDFIVQYEPPKPKSNADRIRAMSDEELSEFINDVWYRFIQEKDWPAFCDICESETMNNCRTCWRNWLRQEVADGEQSKPAPKTGDRS